MLEVLAIVAITFAVYHKTFNFGLIVDDMRQREFIEHPEGIFKNISFFENIKRRLYGVGTLAHRVYVNLGEDHIHAINVKHEHILATALHALIGALIYLAFGSNQVSFWAGILYVLNPANNQTAIWLNGRRYVVNIIIVLLMVCSPWAILLWPFSSLFQVSAVFAPVLLGGYFWLLIPAFLLFGGLITKYRERHGRSPKDMRHDYSLSRLTVIVKSFGFYFFKMLVPGKTFMYYSKLYFWGITTEGNKDAYAMNKDFAKGLLAVFLALTGIVYFQDSLKLYWVFMVLAIVQFSNIVSITQTLADRYMSLPNVFMMFFLSYFAHQTPYALLIIGTISIYYLTRLQTTMEMFRNLEAMYDYHLYHDPQGLSARIFKITECIQGGDNFAAWELVRQGLRYHPKDAPMLYFGALCLAKINPIGNKEQIESFIKEASENVYMAQELHFWDMCNRLKMDIDKATENATSQELAKT